MILSIVIPTYNRKNFAIQAVDSILNQKTAADFHVVVVDDGSSDNSFLELSKRYENNSKVTILKKQNGERGAARNFGAKWICENTNADWLLFFDSDDVLLPSAIEHFSRAANGCRENVVGLYGAIQLWDGNIPYHVDKKVSPCPEGDLSRCVLKKTILPLGATFIRRRVFENIGGFSENRALSGSEDWVFLTQVALAGRINFIPHVLTLYRRHQGNTDLARTMESIRLAMEAAMPIVKDHFKSERQPALSLQRMGILLRAGTLASHVHSKEALSVLWNGVKQDWGLIFEFRCHRILLSLIKGLARTTVITRPSRS